MAEESLNVEELSNDMKNRGVSWTLNPPKASHHSGAWEIKIASVRRCLESAMLQSSNRGLSRDEFLTLLAESMAVVNNSPLWSPSGDPNDPVPLTPAMLITQKDNPHPVPLERYSEADILGYGPKRYRRVQYLADQFWVRWRREYLTTLNKRAKWKKTRTNLTTGDLVLTRDKQTTRNSWPMAIIDKVKLSEDGLVRSVTIRQAPLQGSCKPRYKERAITDLIPLISSQ